MSAGAATIEELSSTCSGADEALAPIASALELFEGASLDEVSYAALLDRIDRKFLMPIALLPDMLVSLAPHYRLLDIDGRRLSAYSTRYLDTPDLSFYRAHHMGRARRYKVRVRRYASEAQSYLEVKLRTASGRTMKQRVLLDVEESALERLSEANLLGVAAAAPLARLAESMLVEYTRVTLVRPETSERVTFDLMLTFRRGSALRRFPGLVIAEAKQAGRARSPFIGAARALNVRERSISKYCAAIACLEPAAKSNRFLPALRRLHSLGAAPS